VIKFILWTSARPLFSMSVITTNLYGSHHVLTANCCHIHEFCCNGLHGVTWHYIFLGCHVEILLSVVVTGSWHIFMGASSVSWTRPVSVAKKLSYQMFMSAHINDIRLQPKIWMLHAVTRYAKFAVIYKKNRPHDGYQWAPVFRLLVQRCDFF
jgi:hypothetical protein